MKKLLLLLLLSSSMFSQTIYEQTFTTAQSLTASGWTLFSQDTDTGVATNWVRTTDGANGIMASFSWYNNVVYSPNNYAFSPAINLTSYTGPIKLSYKHAAQNPDWDAENYTLYVTTSPTVAAATTALHSQTTMNGINTLTEITFDLSSYAGQTIYLCFRHHNVVDQYNIIFDDIKVEKVLPNNVALQSVAVQPIVAAGNQTYSGTVKNIGTNNVTSYTVTWQANGGALQTFNVTGVNITPGSTHNFTHSIPLNAVSGLYNLVFNVPTVNGVSDPDTTNNSLTRTTQVASGSTAFKPLIEKFTSSTCAPCASYNNSTFNPYYTAQNQNFNYIAYQMNWPGTGDPYYTAEGGVRRDYYGVNAITSLWINGAEYSTSNAQAALTTHVNTEATKPAYFGLTANRNLTGGNAVVNYNITPYISGSYVLHAAVIEKVTTNNVASNGETSFKHVMMKMVPNASGTTIACTAGTPLSGQITASIASTFIEQASDLEVIVFIQNPTTKEILQSFTATNALSLEDNAIAKVKLYPNPASNSIQFANVQDATIVITDVTGKVVLQSAGVDENSIINVSHLNSGIYMVNIKNELMNETVKFVKK
jgi:Secretion system C-terminal sorting domain/Cleaved Adhesin Domain/CARDB